MHQFMGHLDKNLHKGNSKVCAGTFKFMLKLWRLISGIPLAEILMAHTYTNQ